MLLLMNRLKCVVKISKNKTQLKTLKCIFIEINIYWACIHFAGHTPTMHQQTPDLQKKVHYSIDLKGASEPKEKALCQCISL